MSLEIRVIRKLGEGAFGTVYLVELGNGRSKYAMKAFDKGNALDPNEINVLKKLRHPQIVQYRHLTVYDGKDAIIMENCESGDLKQYLKQQQTPLDEGVVWEWFAQLSAAISYIHARDIIHRDLKPDNVLIVNGEVKLGDFGLASIMDKMLSKMLTKNGHGTLYYMAPELFKEVAYFGPRSDIWALGCIVYEMCTLKQAFKALEDIIITKWEPIRHSYSSPLTVTVGRMFQNPAEQRIKMAEILNLRQIRDSMPDALAAIDEEETGRPKTSQNETHAPRMSHTSMETVRAIKLRLTNEEVLRFKYEDFSPVEANQNGEYPSIRWQDKRWLARWSEILRYKYSINELPFPPLLLNEDIIDKVVIVIYGWRDKNEFRISGSFHSEVPENVSGLNVQMKLSLTFTNIDNTILTVDKQIIATVEHDSFFTDRLFTLYDVPFASLSLSISPVANISIRRISPEQKWFYFGLAPLIGQHGKFDTIDCNSLHGTFDLAREWKKMVENRIYSYLHLPLLRLWIVDYATVCAFGERYDNKLLFRAKFHWSTPENVKSREILFKIDLHVTTRNNSNLQRQAEKRITLERDWSYNIISIELPWETISADKSPRVRLSILPAN